MVTFTYRTQPDSPPDVQTIQKQMAIVAWQPGPNKVVQVPSEVRRWGRAGRVPQRMLGMRSGAQLQPRVQSAPRRSRAGRGEVAEAGGGAGAHARAATCPPAEPAAVQACARLRPAVGRPRGRAQQSICGAYRERLCP